MESITNLLTSLPAWLILVIIILNIVILVLLILSKTNLTIGKFSLITNSQVREVHNNELRLTIFSEMRSYETYLDNIEMMIFTAFCKLPNLTLDEKTILNYYSNTIRLKLENKLLVDIVANNFRDLEEDDLKLYIKNKTQKYYDMICNCIIDQNDNILPNRDITPSITHINQDILYDIYSYIYRSVITAGKCCDKSSTTTR